MDQAGPRRPTTPQSADGPDGLGGGGGAASTELIDLHAAFASLGRVVLGRQPLEQVLRQVTDLATACIPGADQVSVTVVEDGRARTAAATGATAAGLDEVQYDGSSGPCLEAAESGGAVEVPDTAVDEAYPGFAVAAHRLGVRSTLSVGLPPRGGTTGSLNAYRTGGPAFDAHSVELAQGFAGYAAVALANAALHGDAVYEQMQQAVASRAVIEQAKGVLMGRLGLNSDEAFSELFQQSQRRSRPLRALATEIVERAAQRT